jgi:RNA polymerase sigma factor for flagellar operon FliA
MGDHGEKSGAETGHLQFVRRIAGSVRRQINPPMDEDELVSCGFLGLRQALEKFDPSVNVKFETFAYYRIRGAMLDGISSQCNLSRHMARKLRLARKGNDTMEGASADVGGMSETGPAANAIMLAGILRDLVSVHTMVSVTVQRRGEDGERQVEFVDDAAASRPQEAVFASEMRGLLRLLPAEQARLLDLYYYEDMTMEEAGKKLGVTKSWASKMHAAALRRLREIMEERGMGPDAGP